MALKSLNDVNHRVVGVVTLTVLSAACVFAFAVGQLHLFGRGYTMSGIFSDSAGLERGDDVRVAGVKAGRVSSVKADFSTGTVVVTWHVDADIDLGSAMRAEVQTSTLLGGRYLRLTGPVTEPYMADVNESQRRIPLRRTSVPFTVPKVLDGAQKLVGGLDKRSIDTLLTQVNEIESPSAEKLRRILVNLRQLSQMMNDAFPAIEKLISHSKTITGTLAAKDRELKQIVDASQVLLETLVERRNELAASLGKGSRVVRTLSNVISENERELNTILDNLHLFTKRLAPNMDALNTDFSLLGPTFSQVAKLKGNGPWVEATITGLGPLQPPGPHSTPRQGGGN